MSEEYREIEVVQVGAGPPRMPKPGRPPRAGGRTDLLLTLLVVGVFLGAAGSAYAAWTVRETQQDERMLNCMYLVSFGGPDEAATDGSPGQRQQELMKRFGCDAPDR